MPDQLDDDMNVIKDYAQSMESFKTRLVIGYLSALSNVVSVFDAPAPEDTRVDIYKVMVKTGVKVMVKQLADAIKREHQVDLTPLVALGEALDKAIDDAAKNAQALTAAEWVQAVRAAISDRFTQAPSPAELEQALKDQYHDLPDADAKTNFIAMLQEEIILIGDANVPTTYSVELGIIVAWINGTFDGDCMDGTGKVDVQFSTDNTLQSVTLKTLSAGKLAAVLNRIVSAMEFQSLMEMDVVKRLCRDDRCMCFEGNNVVRKPTDDADAEAFLSSNDAWSLIRKFDE